MSSTEVADKTITTPMNVSARVGPRMSQYADFFECVPMSQSQARATRGGGPWVMSCSWLVLVAWVVNVRQQLCDRFGEGVTANVVIGKLVHGCRSRRQQDGVIRLGDSVGQLDHVMHDSCTVDNLHCSV